MNKGAEFEANHSSERNAHMVGTMKSLVFHSQNFDFPNPISQRQTLITNFDTAEWMVCCRFNSLEFRKLFFLIAKTPVSTILSISERIQGKKKCKSKASR
jgi:hypothetical protein